MVIIHVKVEKIQDRNLTLPCRSLQLLPQRLHFDQQVVIACFRWPVRLFDGPITIKRHRQAKKWRNPVKLGLLGHGKKVGKHVVNRQVPPEIVGSPHKNHRVGLAWDYVG